MRNIMILHVTVWSASPAPSSVCCRIYDQLLDCEARWYVAAPSEYPIIENSLNTIIHLSKACMKNKKKCPQSRWAIMYVFQRSCKFFCVCFASVLPNVWPHIDQIQSVRWKHIMLHTYVNCSGVNTCLCCAYEWWLTNTSAGHECHSTFLPRSDRTVSKHSILYNGFNGAWPHE